jgi:oligoribonuclease
VRVLAWMDLEMTGLDPARHVIVEIATLITDDELNIVAEGPDLVIHATEEQLAGMDEVVVAMHTGSGLLDQIRESRVSLEEAGAATMEFLRSHIPSARAVPLCGNSIGMDRRFLAVHLPDIEEYLHYRSVDVSTIKELARRWYPRDLAGFDRKSSSHRAMDDIRESVDELRYWRERVFRTPEPLDGESPAGGSVGEVSTTGESTTEVSAAVEQRSDGSRTTAGAEPSTGTP